MKIIKNLVFLLVFLALIGTIISTSSAFGLPSYTPPVTYKPPVTYGTPVTTPVYTPPVTTPPVTYKPPVIHKPYVVNPTNPTPPFDFNSPFYASDYQKYLDAKALKSLEDYKKLQQQGLITQAKKAYNDYKNTTKELDSIKKAASSSKPDFKISKTTKNGNTHKVYITNFGKKTASKSTLGIYDGKKLIKKVNVKSIGAGKTAEIKVTLPKTYKNKIKTFKADYTNVVKESNEKNNIFKAK
ncbi:MAG: hypothetical protein FWH29_10430 [Methanobrevibacter sp.]|nr:hypothetical protein [Methanobrevibacter sp.]